MWAVVMLATARVKSRLSGAAAVSAAASAQTAASVVSLVSTIMMSALTLTVTVAARLCGGPLIPARKRSQQVRFQVIMRPRMQECTSRAR